MAAMAQRTHSNLHLHYFLRRLRAVIGLVSVVSKRAGIVQGGPTQLDSIWKLNLMKLCFDENRKRSDKQHAEYFKLLRSILVGRLVHSTHGTLYTYHASSYTHLLLLGGKKSTRSNGYGCSVVVLAWP